MTGENLMISQTSLPPVRPVETSPLTLSDHLITLAEQADRLVCHNRRAGQGLRFPALRGGRPGLACRYVRPNEAHDEDHDALRWGGSGVRALIPPT
jgi:hypothetical protein